METYQRLVESVNNNHGIMLAPIQARSIVTIIQNIDQQLGAAYMALSGADGLVQSLRARLDEHEIDYTDIMPNEEEVIGEVISSEEDGLVHEVGGVDSPTEEEE